MFGKNGISFKTEVTNGECPFCRETTVFVSLYKNIYRCITCGSETEQKVNGAITFMPIGYTGMDKTPSMTFLDEDGS